MLGIFIKALRFAADKHMLQRRKGCDKIPYINHPIKVVQLLYNASESDTELLAAAILHDVLEDTCTTEEEMRQAFGERVTSIVLEVTDDMTLNYDDRKRSQIKRAPALSADAKKIKIADKISNIRDILDLTLTWSDRRKRQYFEWSEKVVHGCRNINPILDIAFDEILKEALGAVPNE